MNLAYKNSVVTPKECYSNPVNCLITGTSGYVGKTLAKHLIACGHRVLEIKGRKDFNELGRLLKEETFDLIIHAGCTTEFVNIYQNEAESPNCRNTSELVNLLNHLELKPYLILIGAAGVFGVSETSIELTEESTGSSSCWFKDYDKTQYIHDKRAQSKILSVYQGLNTTLCLTTVFGKGMAPATLGFYRSIKSKFFFPVPAGGTSYLGEKDFLNAVDVCLKEKPPGTYIISSGNISFKELFQNAKLAMNSENPKLLIRIPGIFLYAFYLAQRILPRFNVLISTFGNKYYSSRKFQETTFWKPQEKIEQIFRTIL